MSSILAMRNLQRLRPVLLRNSLASTQVAFGSNIAGGSMGKAWADKEHAAENQYFSRQDAENLAKLASKLHMQTAVSLRAYLNTRAALLRFY